MRDRLDRERPEGVEGEVTANIPVTGKSLDSIRVLIISSRHPTKRENEEEKRKFGRMCNALFLAGLIGEQLTIRSVRDLMGYLQYSEPDVVLNALTFSKNDAETFQDVMELLRERNYGCIGTSAEALTLIGSKDDLRDLWWRSDIRIPPYFSIRRTEDGSIADKDWTESARNFPYLVRPGTGAESDDPRFHAIAESAAELRMRIGALMLTFDNVLVEEFLGNEKDARRFAVGWIGNKDRSIVMPSELRLSDGLVTGMVTERDISRHRAIVAPVSDERLRDDLERFARAALEIAGARDFARLDILKVGNRLYALDIKVQPAVPDPLFDACALISGLDANQSVTAMFVAGFARLFLEGVAVIAIPSRLRSMMPKPVFSILYG